MENKCYRQGELLFIKVSIPKEVKKETIGQKMNTNCIREGEVSGHKHEVFGSDLMEIKQSSFWYESEKKPGEAYGHNQSFSLPAGQMFLSANNTIEIKHPEHNTLKLEKGDYVIRIQREYEEGKERLVND